MRRLKWSPPGRLPPVPLSSARHLSCWDCANIQTAGMPARRCREYQKRFVTSPTPMGIYVKNYGEDALGIYNGCKKFVIADRLRLGLLLVWDEVTA